MKLPQRTCSAICGKTEWETDCNLSGTERAAFWHGLKSFFHCLGREHVSIDLDWDAERSESRIIFVNIFNDIESIGALNGNLCHSDIALICLSAFAAQKVGQNRVLDEILQSWQRGRTHYIFSEWSAQVCYRLHFCDKQRMVSHNAINLICMVTKL